MKLSGKRYEKRIDAIFDDWKKVFDVVIFRYSHSLEESCAQFKMNEEDLCALLDYSFNMILENEESLVYFTNQYFFRLDENNPEQVIQRKTQIAKDYGFTIEEVESILKKLSEKKIAKKISVVQSSVVRTLDSGSTLDATTSALADKAKSQDLKAPAVKLVKKPAEITFLNILGKKNERERSELIRYGVDGILKKLRQTMSTSSEYLSHTKELVDFLCQHAEVTTFIDWWIVLEKIPHPWPRQFHLNYYPLRSKVIEHLVTQFTTLSDCEALLTIKTLLTDEDISRVYETKDRLIHSK